MAEDIQHTEESPETSSNVEATETPMQNEESETKVNAESEEVPTQNPKTETLSEEKQVEERPKEKNKFRKWIERHTDPKQVGSLIVALVATVIGGLILWGTPKIIAYIRCYTRPYITFESDYTQVLSMSEDVPNLEYSVGEKMWKKLGTQAIVFGGDRGKLMLRGRNDWGTGIGIDLNALSIESMICDFTRFITFATDEQESIICDIPHFITSNISFATDAQIICTGDIRTLIDYKHYKQTNTSKAIFSYLFAGCTQLVVAPELPSTQLADECYASMFEGCTSLKTAPMLPAKELARSCYANMFKGCTSLEISPVLPAKELALSCYAGMFMDCTSLEKVIDVLPAQKLTKNCYSHMFSNCTSLKRAPILPAEELADYCYYGMFKGCTSLSEIHMMVLDIQDENSFHCFNDWLDNALSKGIFYKNKNAHWDNEGIVPEGWEVVLVEPDE